jgi:hypothetical protein
MYMCSLFQVVPDDLFLAVYAASKCFLFQVPDDLFPAVYAASKCFLFQVPDDLFPAVCAAPKWLLNLGFSLGYGAMFTKVQY